jgi:hypothetical protein
MLSEIDYKKIKKEFVDRLSKMNDDELIEIYKRERKNQGWTTSRSIFLIALNEELKKRNINKKI